MSKLPAISTLTRDEYDSAAGSYHVRFVPGTVLAEPDGIAYIKRREVKRLEKILALGLNPIYTSFDDYLFDFYPDFSWNSKDCNTQLRMLLADPDWTALAAQVLESRGIDFVEELQRALDQPEEE